MGVTGPGASTPSRSPLAWRRPESADASVRIFCFPFAGGSAAMYRTWGEQLGNWIDVCPVELPGRGTRFREPLADSMEEHVERLGSALRPLMDRPFVFFGHSMGASVAFALADSLAETGGPTPVTMIVSAARAPGDRSEQKRVSDLDEERFRRHLHRMNGIPPEVEQHAELMDLMMPIVRSDIRVVENWAGPRGKALAHPLVAFGGTQDPFVDSDSLQEWSRFTTAAFATETIVGDHFYLSSAPTETLVRVARHIRQALRVQTPGQSSLTGMALAQAIEAS